MNSREGDLQQPLHHHALHTSMVYIGFITVLGILTGCHIHIVLKMSSNTHAANTVWVFTKLSLLTGFVKE